MRNKINGNNEQILIANIRSGGVDQERAMSDLFKSYYTFIGMGKGRFNLSEDQSLQAYSDTLLSFRRQVIQGKFRGDSKIKTYLFRIFSNKCVDIIRKLPSKELETLENVHQDPVAPQDILRSLIIAEDFKELLREFEKLGESCKQILLLAEYQGYTSAEIADKIGFKNAHTVNSKKHKCLQRLRGNLAKLNLAQGNVKGSENI